MMMHKRGAAAAVEAVRVRDGGAMDATKLSRWMREIAAILIEDHGGQVTPETVQAAIARHSALCVEMIEGQTDRAKQARQELTQQVFGLLHLTA